MLDSGAAHERSRVLGICCHFSGMSHLVAAELMNYFITSNFILILSVLNFSDSSCASLYVVRFIASVNFLN